MNSFRTLRLAYSFLRIAGLEERIQYQVENSKVPEEDIRKLATLDPTGGNPNGGKYLGWLVRNHGNFSNSMADINSWGAKAVRGMLTLYDEAKKKYPALLDSIGLSSDINQVSLNDLFIAWIKYKDIDLVSERERIEKAKKFGAKVTYNKNGVKVVKIEGDNDYAQLAACMYAKGTKWCTSNEEKAGSYLRKGPLYVLFKDGQKILQTDLKEWKNLENKEIDIMENGELSQVLVDSGLLSDPEKITWYMANKYFAGAPRWPAVEPILAQDPKSAFEYAKRTGGPFKLGEPAIASDPGMAVTYAAIVLNGRRFPEAEETIKKDPEWWKVYSAYMKHHFEMEGQEQGVSGSRSLRLAYRFLRIAGLEERIQHYVKERGIPEEDLRRLSKADPTDGKYMGWLIKNVIDPQDVSEYSLGRFRQALAFYHDAKLKNLLGYLELPADIGKLTLDQVYDSWNNHKDEENLRSKAEAAKKAKSVAKVIYTKGPYKILQIGGEGADPKTAIEAACAYSQGTAWCTRTHNTASGYLQRGPLFIGFKGKERLFLANARGSEIHDVHNNPVELTDEILFLLLEAGLLQFWANEAYPSPEKEDKLFNYLAYHLDIYAYKHPELLQYMMDNRMVSQERMARYLEIVGKRLPSVEAYIATDPHAAFIYAKYVLNEPWPEGELAIRSLPGYWEDYQKTFKEEFDVRNNPRDWQTAAG